MSMSIQGSTHAARAAHQAPPAARTSRPDEPAGPDGASADGRRPQARRVLAQALSEALAGLMPVAQGDAAASASGAATTASGAQADPGDSAKALQDFKHELLQALRPAEGDGPGRHGRGFAWGRTSLGDIAQRLESLAQQIVGRSTASDAASTAAAADVAGTGNDALSAQTTAPLPAATTAAAAEPLDLLTAFRALAPQRDEDATGSDGATSLAKLLTRIAQALQTDPAATSPAAGALVDTST